MAEKLQESEAPTSTVVLEDEKEPEERPVLKLKLKKPKTDRVVKWEEGTVDNEFMNKKKSKCCCIYEKPRMFGESSSEEDSDDECSHCHGHKDKDFRQNPEGGAGSDAGGAAGGAANGPVLS